jgi:hypothetical protein
MKKNPAEAGLNLASATSQEVNSSFGWLEILIDDILSNANINRFAGEDVDVCITVSINKVTTDIASLE